jgi:hypothetical protein
MAEIDVDITLGGKLPIDVGPTSTSAIILQGAGRLAGWSLRDVNTTAPVAASGNVVAPAAGADIVALTGLPGGTYTITWTVGLQGAAAAGDADNFQLYDTAGNILASVNPGAAGEYIQPSTEVTVAAGAKIAIKAIAVGTAAVTYAADLSVSPTVETNTVVEIVDGQNTLGEVAFVTRAAETQDFGEGGIVVFQGVTLNVISGTVKGAVFIIPSRGSQ